MFLGQGGSLVVDGMEELYGLTRFAEVSILDSIMWRAKGRLGSDEISRKSWNGNRRGDTKEGATMISFQNYELPNKEEVNANEGDGGTVKAPWSDLPMDLLICISNHLNQRDFIRMKAVSKSWAVVERHERRVNLMSYDSLQCLCNISTPDGNFFKVTHAAFHGKVHVGTSHGWMIMLSSDHYLSVLNPLSSTVIDLPLPRDIQSYQPNASPWVAALSAPPTSPEYVVLVVMLCSPVVLYCRPGDENWRSFTYDPDIIVGKRLRIFGHVFHCMGKCYTLTRDERVITIDCITEEVKDFYLPTMTSYYPRFRYCKRYLVEADGEVLYVIIKLYSRTSDVVKDFEMFRWDPCASTWSRVEDLGGRTLFLGQGGSLSIDGTEEFYGGNLVHVACGDHMAVVRVEGGNISHRPSVRLSMPRERFGWITQPRLTS
ncbi:hypothetical protein QJS10_CPB21g00076 [Acorus calamus]|uniref:F-box domain-containing protein n=1 Tax=Acorus calamus TaxID=4465 RepID=A0AAV9C638_ACOCL|nr:hypothetical protein QJS10_CPB21g00076 [Acorus calamus]